MTIKINFKDNSFFIDIHVLQELPPSCINRDDTNTPKTVQYGGGTRARSSSQCWKHEMRLDFINQLPDDLIGIRTKKAAQYVADEIRKIDDSISEEDAIKMAVDVFKKAGVTAFGKNPAKDDYKMNSILFISKPQARALADLAVHKPSSEKAYEEALINHPSFDQILFGRMVASQPFYNIEACASVAHTISTHVIHNEDDYFVSLDDIVDKRNSGADYIDTSQYNAATVYRFSGLDVNKMLEMTVLDDNLTVEDIAELAVAYINTFVFTMPKGKSKSFANYTIPDFVYVAVRSDRSVNFAPAFEDPIKAKDKGYMKPSIRAFMEYGNLAYEKFIRKPDIDFTVCCDTELTEGFGKPVTMFELEDELKEYIAKRLAED